MQDQRHTVAAIGAGTAIDLEDDVEVVLEVDPLVERDARSPARIVGGQEDRNRRRRHRGRHR